MSLALRVFLLAVVSSLLFNVVEAQDSQSNVTIHVVQRGENLYRISLQYGVTMAELIELNGLADPTNIQVGQRILIPLGNLAAEILPITHTVQPGETVKSIAALYGLTIEELATQNNLADINRIYVGQVLNITSPPIVSPTVQPIASSFGSDLAPMIYSVQAGDTLFRIATRFGLTVNELAQANSINDPTLVYAGQTLIIPGVEAPQLALDLPEVIHSFDMNPLIFVEGETGRFRLSTTVPLAISGTFLGKAVSVAQEPGNDLVDTILVGVPIFTEAGIYPLDLTLSEANGRQTTLGLNVQILAGNYGSERIALQAGSDGLLDPTLEANEQSLIESIMGKFTPTRYFNGAMTLPAAASVSSPFGRKRSYNGGAFDRFHSGTDFAGAPGTPIMAAEAGYVVFSGTLDVRGNATIIDHGWGVFTGYWHQSTRTVNVGDFVNKGQVIGTVGSTGRVTGPHLHWELWVNGVPVDPMQWVKQSFS